MINIKKLLSLLFVYFLFCTTVFAKDLRFVQITDVRYSKEHNSETLEKVIADVNKHKDVDFVVFTGDNIEKPDIQNLKDFIITAKKLRKPFYVLIGDKDVNKHKDLSKKDFQKYLKKRLSTHKTADLNYTFERGGVVFMVVDGAKDVIPSSNGYFKEDTVEWVDTNLALYPNKNVVILQHFPIVAPTDNEGYRTFKPEKYLDVIKKHKNVKAIITGHFEVNKEETVDGVTHITTAPAPNYRVIDILDCTSQSPTFWAEVKNAQ